MSDTELCFIGVSGKKYCGKTSLAKILKKYIETGCRTCLVTIVHLADFLKELYAKENSVELDKLYNDPVFKEQHRQGLIDLGKEKREETLDYWCNIVMEQVIEKAGETIQSGNDRCHVFIIPDIRFPNETHYFKTAAESFPLKTKTLMFRINSSWEKREERGCPNTISLNDPSETSLDEFTDWDHVFLNDFSQMSDLEALVTDSEQFLELLQDSIPLMRGANTKSAKNSLI